MGEDVKVVGYGPGETHRDIAHQARQPWEGEAPGRYQPSSQLRWVSLGLIAAIHIAGFYALQHLNIHIVTLSGVEMRQYVFLQFIFCLLQDQQWFR
mgnify:CR=1 FL=1